MKRQIPTKDQSKGGRVTKSQKINRQKLVEDYMLAGYSLTKISNVMINGKKLASINTVAKDMNIIRSRWLNMDPEWFHRASTARIEAVNRLKQQLIRSNELVTEIKAGIYNSKTKSNKDDGEGDIIESNTDLPTKLVYAESHQTTIINKIYEIDSDFDPEQFLNEKIKEGIRAKIKKDELSDPGKYR